MNIAEMIKLGMKGFKPSDIRSINESGIETKDIISLAENGYKAADVNELIAFAKENAKQTAEQPVVQPETSEDKPQEPAVQTEPGAGNVDYDKQLAEQNTEIANLKKQLAAAQRANSQQNLGSAEPVNPRSAVQEAFKQIY